MNNNTDSCSSELDSLQNFDYKQCTDESSSESSSSSLIALTLCASGSETKSPDQNNAWLRSHLRIATESIPIHTCLSDSQFARTFRMSSTKFEELLAIVAPILRPQIRDRAILGRRLAGSAVLSACAKLQISIRLLAGGSYLDLMVVHHVAYQTIYNVFQHFFCFVSSGKAPQLRIKFPTQRTELEQNARGFQRLTSNRTELYGCVWALDGLQVRIKKPSRSRVPNVLAYCGRSGVFTINMQAICDADLPFTFVSIESPGATHDNTAFTGTDFASKWDSADPSGLFWVAADEAYSVTHNIVTPWPSRSMHDADRKWRDSFNYHFSGGNRNTIERTFSVLVAKWGIFWRPIEYHLEDVPRIILTACVLHNFCLEDSHSHYSTIPGTGPGAPRAYEEISEHDVSFNVVATSDYLVRTFSQRRRDRERSAKRESMTLALKRNGVLRPRYLDA